MLLIQLETTLNIYWEAVFTAYSGFYTIPIFVSHISHYLGTPTNGQKRSETVKRSEIYFPL